MRKLVALCLITGIVHATPTFERQLNELYQRKPWLAPETAPSEEKNDRLPIKRRSAVALYGLARGYMLYRSTYDSSSGGAWGWLVPGVVRSIYHHGIFAVKVVQLGVELQLIDRGLSFLAPLG